MKFIADNMLGKLAKWLRFMGYDVLYPKSLKDRELAKLSIEEDRYLLTRDKNLANMKKIKVLYIQSENPDKQLKQVINEFNLKLNSNLFTRCPECNFLLKEVEKTQVVGKVPKGVLEQQEIFWVCENCGHYYWQGSHYDKIKTKIEELFQ